MHVWESHLVKCKIQKFTFCKKVLLHILITIELLLGMEGEMDLEVKVEERMKEGGGRNQAKNFNKAEITLIAHYNSVREFVN